MNTETTKTVPVNGTPAVAQPTREELLARIAQLEAKANAPRAIGYKVGDKGALSMYGVGRFPVTLYASQWRVVVEQVKSGNLETHLAKFATVLAEKPAK